MWYSVLFIVACLCASVHCATELGSLDLAASAPLTFNHKLGGGAWNLGENARWLDTVESLEGGDWACGDYVTHLIEIGVDPYTHAPNSSITLSLSFNSDSTGQSGVGYGDFGKIQLNTGIVTNGGRTVPIYGPPFVYGKDTAVSPNPGGMTVTVLSKFFDRGLFVQQGNLNLNVRINNVPPNIKTVLRVDVQIFCLPGSHPTGDLQGSLLSASLTWPGQSTPVDVQGGAQTIPLKNVNDIAGIAPCTATNITGIDFKATVAITDPNMGTGGTSAQFYYSWSRGGFAIQGTTTNFTEVHTYDAKCTPSQAGQLQYNKGACGCEVTSIISDQPQFFFTTTGNTYYQMPGTPVTINGVQYLQYFNATPGPVLSLIYAYTANPPPAANTLFRAILTDGRIITFYNVTSGNNTVPAGVFDIPANASTTCTCERLIDMVILMDRDYYVVPSAFFNAQTFAKNFASQFTIGSSAVQIGVSWYDGSYTQQLSVAAGNTLTNVQNAIGAINCVGGKSVGCGVQGAVVDVASYITKACNDLKASPRWGVAAPALVLITTGWNTTTPAVSAAVSYCNSNGIQVFAGVYNNILLFSDIQNALDQANPRNVVYEFTDSVMSTSAGIPYLLQLAGIVCLASRTPCGTTCCGACDTTCGKCLPVTSCPTASTNCSSQTQIIGGCCVKTNTTGCPAKGNCTIGTCNVASGLCTYSYSCKASDACQTTSCVNNQCVTSSLAQSDFCRIQVCQTDAVTGVGIALQWQARNNTCPPTSSCTRFVCNATSKSCDAVPVATTLVSPDKCHPVVCNPTTNVWEFRNVTCVSDTANCMASYCELATGSCVSNTICPPRNASLGKCDTSGCVNGACVTSQVNCAAPADLCLTNKCDPATGSCYQTPAKQCPLWANDNCTQTVCNSSTGVCDVPPPSNRTAACLASCPCTTSNICNPKTGCNQAQTACTTAPRICTAPDSCTLSTCVPTSTTGCVDTPIPISTCPTQKCHDTFQDPTNTTSCCQLKPKDCSGPDICRNYFCDATTGNCTSAYKCIPSGNACRPTVCDPVLGCIQNTTVCTSTDACLIPSCDPILGCQLTAKPCDDQDSCTTDTCVNGQCVNTVITCSPGNSLCYTSSCTNGVCSAAPITCDDGIDCTLDAPCDPVNGTCPPPVPQDAMCRDANPCKTWQCVVGVGCVSSNVTCPTNGTDLCTGVSCIDWTGCTLQSTECTLNSSVTDCSTTHCDLTTGDCVIVPAACNVVSSTVLVAAALSTAAIVGIIIAIVACVGFGGGATFAVYNKYNGDGIAPVTNNPLFVSAGRDKLNPLYSGNA